MKKKPIALAFSDHHAAAWKQHNKNDERTKLSFYILNTILGQAKKHDIPVLFTGDLIDHPKRVDNKVLYNLSMAFRNHRGVTFIGINGNHDIYQQSSNEDPSPGYLHSLSNLNPDIFCVDNNSMMTQELMVHGIPYYHGDVGFVDRLKMLTNRLDKKRKNILLIHRDLAGAVEPTGEIIEKNHDQDKSLKKYFKYFDLVLSGHIHKSQKIKALGNNIYMLGATNQQRRSDMGQICGYWEIYMDNTMEFIPLEVPEFRTYRKGEGIDDYHYWIELPEDIKSVEQLVEETHFDVNSDRKKMVKSYMKAKGVKSKSKRLTALKYLG